MPTDPRSVVEEAARALLRALADLPGPTALRVAEADGRLACLVMVWEANRVMPVVAAERRRRAKGVRGACKHDILRVIEEANRPLTRKEVVKALRRAEKDHGSGTVAKALADLTASGELVNPQDKRGYRLAGWDRERPSLFD